MNTTSPPTLRPVVVLLAVFLERFIICVTLWLLGAAIFINLVLFVMVLCLQYPVCNFDRRVGGNVFCSAVRYMLNYVCICCYWKPLQLLLYFVMHFTAK